MSVALLVMLGLLVGKWIALGALVAAAAAGVALGTANCA